MAEPATPSATPVTVPDAGQRNSIPVVVRPLESVDEFHESENIQKAVWAFSEREVVPANELIAISRIGGSVLGAFDGRGRLLGFSYGMPGLEGRKVIFHGRMTGVLPEHQGRDIGLALKLAQRTHIRSLKIAKATWTFDPLQSLNAYFNIERLGCVCRSYVVNAYGRSTSPLNRGWDTDRLVPEWLVDSERVERHLAGKIPAISIPAALESKDYILVLDEKVKTRDLAVPGEPRLDAKTRFLLVQIPHNILMIKNLNPEFAKQWRERTRTIFQHYLARKYVVTRFIVHRPDKIARCYYVLERGYALE